MKHSKNWSLKSESGKDDQKAFLVQHGAGKLKRVTDREVGFLQIINFSLPISYSTF